MNTPESEKAHAEKLQKFCPEFMEMTQDILFGKVWSRPGLSQRDRSLITVATLVATHKPAQLPHHVRRALDNGITKHELLELFMHLAYYAGWPAAFSAIDVAMEILPEDDTSAL